MRTGIKEALLRVTGIVVQAESEHADQVHSHDKACEKFHDRASSDLWFGQMLVQLLGTPTFTDCDDATQPLS